MSHLPPFRTRRPGTEPATADDLQDDEPMLLDEDAIVRESASSDAARDDAGTPPWEELPGDADDDIPTLTTVVEPVEAPEPAASAAPGDATADEDAFFEVAPASAATPLRADPAQADARPAAGAPDEQDPRPAPSGHGTALLRAGPPLPPIPGSGDDTAGEAEYFDVAPEHATVPLAPAAPAAGADSVEAGLGEPAAAHEETAGVVVVLDEERIELLVDDVMDALQPALREAVRAAVRRNLLDDGAQGG